MTPRRRFSLAGPRRGRHRRRRAARPRALPRAGRRRRDRRSSPTSTTRAASAWRASSRRPRPAVRRAIRAVAADITVRQPRQRCATPSSSGYDRIDVLVNNAAHQRHVRDAAAAAELSRFEAYPLERCAAVARRQRHRHLPLLPGARRRDGRGGARAASSTSPRPTGSSAPTSRSTGSPTARRPSGRAPAYPTSKGAVLAFTRFLATYWGSGRRARQQPLARRRGQAGRTPTSWRTYARRTPLGRMAHPDELPGRGRLPGQRRLELHDRARTWSSTEDGPHGEAVARATRRSRPTAPLPARGARAGGRAAPPGADRLRRRAHRRRRLLLGARRGAEALLGPRRDGRRAPARTQGSRPAIVTGERSPIVRAGGPRSWAPARATSA